jgi:hypothetical protein
MSGTAALSAARKRRASSVQPPYPTTSGTPSSFSNKQNTYYNPLHSHSMNGGGVGNNIPNPNNGNRSVNMVPQNMTIYENIDLIKAQMEERLHIMTTQARTLPADKMKILQKQQEIQTQILKQKIIIAQQMEMENEPKQGPHFPTNTPVPVAIPSVPPAPVLSSQPRAHLIPKPIPTPSTFNEPPIIFDKGIPRPNPKYVAPSSIVEEVKEVFNTNSSPKSNTPQTPQHPQPAQIQQPPPQQNRNTSNNSKKTPNVSMPTAKLTPFVSMTSVNGVIPPPIVILKSHDEKIGEHDAVLNDLTNRMNYMHTRIEQIETSVESNIIKNLSTSAISSSVSHNNDTNNEKSTKTSNSDKIPENHNEEDEEYVEEEATLLMDEVIGDLLNSRDFMQGVVDKIMNDTNLADVILKIDPVIKENQELRSLVHSQQQMLNQMNTMLLTLLNSQQHEKLPTENNSHNNDNTYSNNNENMYQSEHNAIHDMCDDNGLYSNDNVEEVVDCNGLICDMDTSSFDISNEVVHEKPDESHAEQIYEPQVEQPDEIHSEQRDEPQVELPTELSTELPTELPSELSTELPSEQPAEHLIEEVDNEDNTAPHFPDVHIDNSRITLLVQEINQDEI